jgi:hypothetical protein
MREPFPWEQLYNGKTQIKGDLKSNLLSDLFHFSSINFSITVFLLVLIDFVSLFTQILNRNEG